MPSSWPGPLLVPLFSPLLHPLGLHYGPGDCAASVLVRKESVNLPPPSGQRRFGCGEQAVSQGEGGSCSGGPEPLLLLPGSIHYTLCSTRKLRGRSTHAKCPESQPGWEGQQRKPWSRTPLLAPGPCGFVQDAEILLVLREALGCISQRRIVLSLQPNFIGGKSVFGL